MRGKVQHKFVIILINLGHNFVDIAISSQLHIPVDSTQILKVKVANGEMPRTHGCAKMLLLCCKDINFLHNCMFCLWEGVI